MKSKLPLIFFGLLLFNQAIASEPKISGTLAFGGSFSPPTLEHMGLETRIMARFSILSGVMLPTLPYKTGAAPAAVSLRRTKIAVAHLNEVLDLSSVPYSLFKSDLKAGKAEWSDSTGKTFHLETDDYDIRTKNASNTLQTLIYLEEKTGGNPKELNWLAGSDSFISVPTWTNGSSDWVKLFDHSNWIVVSRPGFSQQEGNINFERVDPLGALGEPWVGFLKQYRYQFYPDLQVHHYENLEPAKPGIFIILQPVLDDSSSANRASLIARDDHLHAQIGLQPSVFKDCLESPGYLDEQTRRFDQTELSAFTRKNLEIYLHWMFNEIERQSPAGIRPNAHDEYNRMALTLIRRLKNENPKDLLIQTGKKFALPTLNDLRVLFNKAPTSTKNYRNQLLQGDPDTILARAELTGMSGFVEPTLKVDVVQSRLSSQSPLWLRRWDDHRVKWHDLNISTNELKAAIQNPNLVTELERSSLGSSPGLYSSLLLLTALDDPAASWPIRLLVTRRLFNRFWLGEVSTPIFSTLPKESQNRIQNLALRALPFREGLSTKRLENLRDGLSGYYSLSSLISDSPELLENPNFWNKFIDFLGSQYPNRRFKFSSKKKMGQIIWAIEIFAKEFRKDHPSAAGDRTIYYRGNPLFRISSSKVKFLDSVLQATRSQIPEEEVAEILIAAEAYLNSNRDYLKPINSPSQTFVKPLPKIARTVSGEESNLAWAMSLYASNEKANFDFLRQTAYPNAKRYLKTRSPSQETEQQFENVVIKIDQNFANSLQQIDRLIEQWTEMKSQTPSRFSIQMPETSISGYRALLSRFREIQRDIELYKTNLTRLNQSMLGLIFVDLKNKDNLNEFLESLNNSCEGITNLN